MQITPSTSPKGHIGIFGHAGVGHVHSHLGFVQDDSAGLAVVASLLKAAYPANTLINKVFVDHSEGTITVYTKDGGSGTAFARRGFTPYEAELSQHAVGLDAQFSQAVAFRTFGRIYGQGVMEAAVALQAACALALLDTFEVCYPGEVLAAPEDIPGNIGRVLGAIVDFDTTPVVLLATVNATAGGLGPNEDLEGNISLGGKGSVMRTLGLNATTPGIIVESKSYVPGISDEIPANTFFIRANSASDNETVAQCLTEAASELDLPHRFSDRAFPRGNNELALSTAALGQRIAALGMQLAAADTAGRKVEIVGELAEIISQDAGGVTFMSNPLHNVVSGAGTIPGTAAVISLLVTQSYIQNWRIPMLTPNDVDQYTMIISGALEKLASRRTHAESESHRKANFNEQSLSHLLRYERGA